MKRKKNKKTYRVWEGKKANKHNIKQLLFQFGKWQFSKKAKTIQELWSRGRESGEWGHVKEIAFCSRRKKIVWKFPQHAANSQRVFLNVAWQWENYPIKVWGLSRKLQHSVSIDKIKFVPPLLFYISRIVVLCKLKCIQAEQSVKIIIFA